MIPEGELRLISLCDFIAWPWRVQKSLFDFYSLSGKGVKYLCLQCKNKVITIYLEKLFTSQLLL